MLTKVLFLCISYNIFMNNGYASAQVDGKSCARPPINCNNHLLLRTHDGTCNNLENPYWGKAIQPFVRRAKNVYSDGIHEYPVQSNGKPYPSAREVSNIVFLSSVLSGKHDSLTQMSLGQIVAHDMSLATFNTNPETCCVDGQVQEPGCDYIPIPLLDLCYNSKNNISCLPFQRSFTTKDYGCYDRSVQKEQTPINVVTPFLDLSIIYANSDEDNLELRTGQGGKLKSVTINGEEFPIEYTGTDKTAICNGINGARVLGSACFRLGDIRANQNPGLLTLHVLFHRNHNFICDNLIKIHPHWSDTQLYNLARKINIAQSQKVIYYELLSTFLGWDNMVKAGVIYENKVSCVNDYDSRVNPSVALEHTSSSWRYFHTNIVGPLKPFRNELEFTLFPLEDWMDTGESLVLSNDVNYTTLLRGLCKQPRAKTDNIIDPAMKCKLFKDTNGNGQDLVAIDIQRTRDHAVPPYNTIRRTCNLPVADTWSEFALLGDINPLFVAEYATLYASPDDVELYVSANLENHVEGTLVGPTNLCILIDQFLRTRRGDRFFFENCNEGAFTDAQLAGIKAVSLSGIYCANSDLEFVQPHVIKVPGLSNIPKSCSSYKTLDFSLWIDTIPI